MTGSFFDELGAVVGEGEADEILAGAAIGAGLCLPMLFLVGGALALLLGLLSAVAFVASGAIAVREMEAVRGAPAPVWWLTPEKAISSPTITWCSGRTKS